MKHNFKKILSIVLLVTMCLNLFPMGVFAEDADIVCPGCYQSGNVTKLEVVTEPSCTAAAGTWYECSNAHGEDGIVHRFIIQTAPAHHSNEAKVTKTEENAATHTADGNIAYWTCNECDKYFSNFPCTNEIEEGEWVVPADADAHVWPEEWTIIDNPVCGVKDGLQTKECTDPACDATIEETIPGVKHNWVLQTEGLEDISCLDEVEVTFNCVNEGCGATKVVDGYGWKHDPKLVGATTANCTVRGTEAYWDCIHCNTFFAVTDEGGVGEEIEENSWILSFGHVFNHVDAKDATCTEDGNVEYYECTECECKFDNDANENEGKLEDVVIEATGHDLTHAAEQDATCLEDGNFEYWFCANCEIYFQDEKAEVAYEADKHIKPALGHDMTFHEAVAATCTAPGTVAYYACANCEKNFADEAGETVVEQIIASIMVPNPDGTATTIEAAYGSELYNQYAGAQHEWKCTELERATCTKSGARAWTCQLCGEFNGFGKTIVHEIPAINHANAVIEPEVPSTCTTKGTPAYAYCADCNGYLEVAADGTIKTATTYSKEYMELSVFGSLELNPLVHEEESCIVTPAKDATCYEFGYGEYTICEACNNVFQIVDEVVVNYGEWSNKFDYTQLVGYTPVHKPVYVDYVAADCFNDGNIAHYACADCEAYYEADEQGQIVIVDGKYVVLDDVVIPAAHNYVEGEITYTCGEAGLTYHYRCTECEGYFLYNEAKTPVEMDQMGLIMVGATNQHDPYIAEGEEMIPCQGADMPGKAGVERCHGCTSYVKYINQHTYTKVDVIEKSTCTTKGTYMMECERCGAHELDANGKEIIYTEALRAHTDFTPVPNFHAAVPSTCIGGLQNGNYAYYECDGCGGKFKDSQLTDAYAEGEEIDVAAHTPVAHSTTATACSGNYDVEQFCCSVCGLYSMTEDFAETSETPYTDAIGGHLNELTVVVPAAESSCFENGTKEIKYCADCEKYYVDGVEYADLEAAKEAAQLELVAHNGFNAGYEATCTEEGVAPHFFCDMCKKYYAVAEEGVAGEEITNYDDQITLPKIDHAAVEYVPAQEPYCTSRTEVVFGNHEYYVCSCGAKFATEAAPADQAGLTEDEILIKHELSPVKVDLCCKAPTCENFGYDTLICACGYEYVEFIAPLYHSVTKSEAAEEPSCSEDGQLEFYYCENCETYYSDADCQTPICNEDGEKITSDDETVIPATGEHKNAAGEVITEGCVVDADYVCVYGDRCDKYDADAEVADLRVEHEMIPGHTDANCVTPESDFKACKNCNWVDPETLVTKGEKSGEHPTDEGARRWVETTPSTNCFTPAILTEYCNLCGEATGATAEGETLDHDYVEHEATFDCVTAGMKAHLTCSYEGCDKYFTTEKVETTYEDLYVEQGQHIMGAFVNVEGLENDYLSDVAEVSTCGVCGHEEFRAHQDIKFSVSIDNAVVAGAELVNSGKLAVTIKISSYAATAKSFKLSFQVSDNLIFDEEATVWSNYFVDNFSINNVGKSGNVITLFSFVMGDGVSLAGQDTEYVTLYFTITNNNDVKISALNVNEMVYKNADGETDRFTNFTYGEDATAEVVVMGDVDGDGEIGSLLDIEAMIPFILTPDQVEYNARADFDKDGEITAADFDLLIQYQTSNNYGLLIA